MGQFVGGPEGRKWEVEVVVFGRTMMESARLLDDKGRSSLGLPIISDQTTITSKERLLQKSSFELEACL
jgi:hypothetical protein